MESESFELIGLCEEILDDNEVTVEEVRRLGDWLTNHEDARRSWPGKELAAPVQEALLDDKVNKTELKRIASLVRRIQKEWVRRREEAVEKAALEKAAASVRIMDLSSALLPIIPVTLRVDSHSDKNVFYEVDLSGPSCNCPDWKGARSHVPKGSLTRCCKHVLDAFGRLRPTDGWPGWLGAFLEQGWKPHPAKRWFVIPPGPNFTLASVGGNDWADVFAMATHDYQRFGYNIVELRWSYGQSPPEANAIEHVIHKEAQGRAR